MKLPIQAMPIARRDSLHPVNGGVTPSEVKWVKREKKALIESGQLGSPCGPGQNLCWGTGRHSLGYECCDARKERCAFSPTGRPVCDPFLERRMLANEIGNTRLVPDVGNRITSLLGALG